MKERFPNGLDRDAGAKSRSGAEAGVEEGGKTDERIEAESPLPFTGTIGTIAGKVKMCEAK